MEKGYSFVDKTFEKIRGNKNHKTLKELVEIVPCGMLQKYLEDEYSVSIKFISNKHIPENGYIKTFEERKINIKSVPKIETKLITNDVVIISAGSLSQVGIIQEYSEDDNVFGFGRLIRLRVKTNEINPKALFMYLRSEIIQTYFQMLTSKRAALPQILPREISDIPFPMNQHNQLVEKFDKVSELYKMIENAENEIKKLCSFTI